MNIRLKFEAQQLDKKKEEKVNSFDLDQTFELENKERVLNLVKLDQQFLDILGLGFNPDQQEDHLEQVTTRCHKLIKSANKITLTSAKKLKSVVNDIERIRSGQFEREDF